MQLQQSYSARRFTEKLPHTAPSDVASPHAVAKSARRPVAANARIGENTIIEAFCTIYSDVEIGAEFSIKPARASAGGLWFERDTDGVPDGFGIRGFVSAIMWKRDATALFAPARSVEITMRKIDDNVLVAHNCTIGGRTMIAGCAISVAV